MITLNVKQVHVFDFMTRWSLFSFISYCANWITALDFPPQWHSCLYTYFIFHCLCTKISCYRRY